jgi:hypothetical protein
VHSVLPRECIIKEQHKSWIVVRGWVRWVRQGVRNRGDSSFLFH